MFGDGIGSSDETFDRWECDGRKLPIKGVAAKRLRKAAPLAGGTLRA